MGGFSSVHQTWFSTTGFNLRGGCCRLCLGMVPEVIRRICLGTVPWDGPLIRLAWSGLRYSLGDSLGLPMVLLGSDSKIGKKFEKPYRYINRGFSPGTGMIRRKAKTSVPNHRLLRFLTIEWHRKTAAEYFGS